MKAFRNVAGNVVEIEVDIDLNGKPILPPDTTVDSRPAAEEGHYVTVVGDKWVQIPITVPFIAFETKQQNALNKIREYKAWYVNQPIELNGTKFDADKEARDNLTQALTVYQANAYLPPAWIDFNNGRYPLAGIDDLKAISIAVQTAYSSRFFEMDDLRQQVMAAQNEAELDLISIPNLPVAL